MTVAGIKELLMPNLQQSQKVKEIVGLMLECPSRERAAYLDQVAC